MKCLQIIRIVMFRQILSDLSSFYMSAIKAVLNDETENKSRRMKRIISQTDLSMSTAYPVCIYFSPVAGTDNLIKVAKNGIHREATGRHVK